jgi:hypothetical protein
VESAGCTEQNSYGTRSFRRLVEYTQNTKRRRVYDEPSNSKGLGKIETETSSKLRATPTVKKHGYATYTGVSKHFESLDLSDITKTRLGLNPII